MKGYCFVGLAIGHIHLLDSTITIYPIKRWLYYSYLTNVSSEMGSLTLDDVVTGFPSLFYR